MAYRATEIGMLLSSPNTRSKAEGVAMMKEALRQADGNLAAAARILGVPWRTAYRWAEKAGLEREKPDTPRLTNTAIIAAGKRHGSVGKAARALGVSRNTLAKRAKAAGITIPDGREKTGGR